MCTLAKQTNITQKIKNIIVCNRNATKLDPKTY
jgi:hypothetical protein